MIVIVAARSSAGALLNEQTFLRGSAQDFLRQAVQVSDYLLLRHAWTTQPARALLDLYLHGAGIEKGYGFFAPKVSRNCKLAFELHYADGRSEVVLPTIRDRSSALRLMDLLARLQQIQHPGLREEMVRTMASAVWSAHPEAVSIRAVFGTVDPPGRAAYLRGEAEQYEPLFGYDFERSTSGR